MLSSSRLLWLLVPVDLALVAVHVSSARLTASHLDPSWLAVHRWRVDADGGVAESFQYLKYLAIACAAALLYRRLHVRSGLVLCVFALLLLVDDSLQVHERFGEPILWVVHGSVFLAYLVTARGSQDPRERALATKVVGVVTLLALFGVALDAVNGRLIESAVETVLALAVEGIEGFDAASLGIVLLPTLPASVSVVLGALQAQALLTTDEVVSALRGLRLLVVGLAVLEDGGEMVVLSVLVVGLLREVGGRAAVRRHASARIR
ncbi:MAG TPA: hypothetical protein VFN03_03385 [Trueperaceae bacterium]|nr:hypothetical protein [Trueperaceae bacterium]